MTTKRNNPSIDEVLNASPPPSPDIKPAPKPKPAKPTAKPKPPRNETPSALADLANRERQLTEAAESVFAKMAEGATLTPNEHRILRAAGPRFVPGDRASKIAWEKWVSHEKSRLAKVHELQAEAGSAGERESSRSAAEKAEAKAEERNAEIDSEIARLTSEKNRLEEAATQARAESDRREAAVERLRTTRLLPGFVVDEMRFTRDRWTAAGAAGRELAQKRSRLAILEKVAKIDVSPPRIEHGEYVGGRGLEDAMNHVRGNASLGGTERDRLARFGLLPSDGRPVRPEKLNRSAWASYISDVQSEIAELRDDIARLETEEATHSAEMKRLSSFYVPE